MSESENLQGLITSDDILGKDVIDKKGRYIGVLSILHIEKDAKTITGISIDTGFMRPTVYVGINMINNFGVDAVYISHTPGSRYLGLKVFDKYGVYVGKVRKTRYKKNLVSHITVKRLFYKVELDVHYVNTLGCNILLNLEKKEVWKTNDSMK